MVVHKELLGINYTDSEPLLTYRLEMREPICNRNVLHRENLLISVTIVVTLYGLVIYKNIRCLYYKILNNIRCMGTLTLILLF